MMRDPAQETLAGEWQKRMAARSGLVALLLAIPVLVAAVIGFSGGLGAFPLGISSLATGPDEAPLEPASQPTRALNLGGGTRTAAASLPGGGPGASGSTAGSSGDGVATISPGSTSFVPTSSGGAGSGSDGGSGGGSPGSSGSPPAAPPSSPSTPSQPAPSIQLPVDPTGGAVSGAVNQVNETVGGVLDGDR
jgi:hypothetical protein